MENNKDLFYVCTRDINKFIILNSLNQVRLKICKHNKNVDSYCGWTIMNAPLKSGCNCYKLCENCPALLCDDDVEFSDALDWWQDMMSQHGMFDNEE
jgi:hypothetical protein